MISLINDRLNEPFQVREGELHCFINPYTYRCLRSVPEILEKFDVVHFDGMTMCWIYALFGIRRVPRRSFDMTSVAKYVFEHAASEGKTVAFVGTEEGVIEKAVSTLRDRFSFDVALVRNGFFSSDEEIEKFQRHLAETNPDIVIVGMGAVRQERFLGELKELGWNGTGFTCGGFLHQTATRLEFYPGVFDRLNLRWAYRIWKDPYVFRRYLFDYPKFVVQFAGDYLRWLSTKDAKAGLRPADPTA